MLTSCSGVKKLNIFKEEVPRAQLNLEKPTPLELEQLRWIIITSENAEEVFKKLEEQGIDPVIFGLTDKDFELLAKNFARIRNQLKITNDLFSTTTKITTAWLIIELSKILIKLILVGLLKTTLI